MEDVDIIGKAVRGFRFESSKYNNGCLIFIEEMEPYVGLLGKVHSRLEGTNLYRIQFSDGARFSYPGELIEQYLYSPDKSPEASENVYEIF